MVCRARARQSAGRSDRGLGGSGRGVTRQPNVAVVVVHAGKTDTARAETL